MIGDLAGPELMPMDIDMDANLLIPDVALPAPKALLKDGKTSKTQVSQQLSKIAASECGKQNCSAWLLIIVAHIRNMCLTCQINLIYGNPCIDIDCGWCSSCCHDTPPDPHPHLLPVPSISDDPQSPIEDDLDKTPKWQWLTRKDLIIAAQRLMTAACHIWLLPPVHEEAAFLSYTCFLTDTDIKNITCDLHLVSLKEVLVN